MNMGWGLAFGIAVVGLVGYFILSFQARGEEVIILTDSGEHKFQVEIADTPETRSRGLMERPELDEDRGMLFLYPSERQVTMWMKNTMISLDMLFIDPNGRIVRVARNARPYSLSIIPSGEPVIAVLELAGGVSKAIQVKKGDLLKSSVPLRSANQ